MVIVALGLHLLADARLFLGGVPGLAFLLTHATALPLGLALFVVNLPFCALAWRVLGTRFTLRSLLAMALLSATVEAVRAALVVQHVHPALAAVAGGLLVGTGLLILLRHRASLGGVGVVAIALQRRFGWNVGHVQLAADALILAAALPLADGPRMLWSLLAAAALNGVLMWNHRPGRYPAGAM
jgi:uncharacterized membrane-anchored protein YitT (DUF2179 family)